MAYGKNIETKGKTILAGLLAIILITPISKVSADALSDQLTASQQKLLQLNQQINSYQQQIAQVQSKSSTLKNEISIYNDQIASTQLAIEAKQTQIDGANLQITQLQRQIDEKTQDIANNQQVLAQLISELNEDDDQYALKTTIGSSNLSDFLDQIQYAQNLQAQVYQLVEKIKALKTQLQAQQQALQIQVKQLQSLQEQLQVTQDSLTTVRNQKQQLLNQTQGLEKNFQKLLVSSKQTAVNLQKEIEDLDNQVKAKLGKSGAINAVPGLLAWPIDGILTQGYGNTGFTSLGYSFHNGIDVAGPPGQPIYAAVDGVVYDDDHSSQDFGNWVALKSTIITASGPAQIITLYGHMQKYIVAIGQSLKQGDLIGYEGNTGNTTAKLYGPERGYHLHFGVYNFNGFGVTQGAYTKTYGPYKVPYGYTYNPLTFLPAN
ncbi:MAG: peptidoglycan DD-metalloendopeptidase family protein [Candidatus Doudnabacteria bacterium]|nr:peptidoglycan DD-metalloendopeptidase family protein [Candidatus Doudnabacteria bacterium]